MVAGRSYRWTSMKYRQTTMVPNELFDVHLPYLSLSELKVFLVIIRQTNGWIDKRTGKRKVSDRISHSQFIRKTGLSRRVISSTIQKLISRGLIEVKNQKGDLVSNSEERRGKRLWYSITQNKPQSRLQEVRSVGEILKMKNYSI